MSKQLGTGTIMARDDVRRRSGLASALLAVAVFCASAGSATAEVRVTDAGAGRLVVEAHDATVRQVLDALSASQTIRVRSSDALSRAVTGTYSGTLPRVLSRILDGYDHVIQSTSSGLWLDVVGAAQTAKSAVPVANGVTVADTPHPGARISSNVDLDEEMEQTASAGPRTVNAPATPMLHAAAPAIRPVAAVLAGSVQRPTGPRISSNVDLDEEMGR
jgi:hypothetical protein